MPSKINFESGNFVDEKLFGGRITTPDDFTSIDKIHLKIVDNGLKEMYHIKIQCIERLFSQNFWDKDQDIQKVLKQKKNKFSKAELKREKVFEEYKYHGRAFGHDPDNEDIIY